MPQLNWYMKDWTASILSLVLNRQKYFETPMPAR